MSSCALRIQRRPQLVLALPIPQNIHQVLVLLTQRDIPQALALQIQKDIPPVPAPQTQKDIRLGSVPQTLIDIPLVPTPQTQRVIPPVPVPRTQGNILQDPVLQTPRNIPPTLAPPIQSETQVRDLPRHRCCLEPPPLPSQKVSGTTPIAAAAVTALPPPTISGRMCLRLRRVKLCSRCPRLFNSGLPRRMMIVVFPPTRMPA